MSLKTVQLNNIRLAYEDAGSGQPVVMLHGYPFDHTMWNSQIEAIQETHRVIAPDLRGFGNSTLEESDPSQGVEMQKYASDVLALLDKLKITEPVILCGFSMGGYILWQFVLHHPERVRALVPCDTRALADSEEARQGRLSTAEEVMKTGVEPIIEAMLPKLLADETRNSRLEIVERVAAIMRKTSPAAVAAALRGMAGRPDVTGNLADIKQPALVLGGAADAISPPAEMRQMADTLQNAAFIEIPSAGHVTVLENPEAVNEAMVDFIQQVS